MNGRYQNGRNALTFSGVDAQTHRLPSWFQTYVGTPTGQADGSFTDAYDGLAAPERRTLAYRDDQTGEWVEDGRYVALVNPEWEGENAQRPQNTALYHVASDRYDPVTPSEIFDPLADLFRDVCDADDPESTIYGEIREYRNGGEVHADLFCSEWTVQLPAGESDDGQTWTLGLQTGYDYFTQRTLYADVIAANPAVGSVHRALGDRRTRRHYKSPDADRGKTRDEIAEWWTQETDRMETVSQTLYGVVHDAMNYQIEFSGVPVGPSDYLTAHGFPESLADDVTDRLGGSNVERISAYDLHTAIMSLLTETYEGKDDGTAIRSHVGVANDVLFEPPRFENVALDKLTADVSSQSTLPESCSDESPQEIRATLRERRETAKSAMDSYLSMQDRVRRMVRDAEDADTQEAEA